MNARHHASFHVPADHPSFAGHFPGQPLLPGVLLLAEVLEAALAHPALARRIGAAPRLASAKFLAPVRAGDNVEITFDAGDTRVGFELRCGERLAASGQFDAAFASIEEQR